MDVAGVKIIRKGASNLPFTTSRDSIGRMCKRIVRSTSLREILVSFGANVDASVWEML